MQTRLDLPPAPKQTRIATQKPANSLMKYLKIRQGDLPYAAGVAAGVIYLTLNDAFFVFVLASFALVFGAMYYCAKVVPFIEKTALVNRGMIRKKVIAKFEGFFLSDKELEHPKI